MLRVLFLCTENACHSQMAEGLLNHDLAGHFKAFSAGVRPSRVNPRAIQVMGELGIDISQQRSKALNDLAVEQFDLVITVCDRPRNNVPCFPEKARACPWAFQTWRRPPAPRRKYGRPSGGCGTPCGSK